jgi:hypothetical protein
VEALDYLEELDDDFFTTPSMRGFHPHTIDLAHVRFAAVTALTAIDLCAAALGNWYCGVPGDNHALDLADIRPWPRKETKGTSGSDAEAASAPRQSVGPASLD